MTNEFEHTLLVFISSDDCLVTPGESVGLAYYDGIFRLRCS